MAFPSVEIVTRLLFSAKPRRIGKATKRRGLGDRIHTKRSAIICRIVSRPRLRGLSAFAHLPAVAPVRVERVAMLPHLDEAELNAAQLDYLAFNLHDG